MITKYRGFTIEAKRERSMGGWENIYFSIFRDSDGYECTSGFTGGSDNVRSFVRHMKERIDAELLDLDPWGEKAEGGFA